MRVKHRISAVPVVDASQRVVGIVSEGDLMRRAENHTDERHAWWLESIFSMKDKAGDYIKTHGRKAADVMSQNVVTITEDTPLHEIAWLLEKHHIKRVPVTRDAQLVGIVSRANLLQGLAAKGASGISPSSSDDQTIREQLLHALSKEAGLDTTLINVIVHDGAVQLWGIVNSDTEIEAVHVAIENTPGIKSVENHLSRVPAWALSY